MEDKLSAGLEKKLRSLTAQTQRKFGATMARFRYFSGSSITLWYPFNQETIGSGPK